MQQHTCDQSLGLTQHIDWLRNLLFQANNVHHIYIWCFVRALRCTQFLDRLLAYNLAWVGVLARLLLIRRFRAIAWLHNMTKHSSLKFSLVMCSRDVS